MKSLIIKNEDHFHFKSDEEAISWAASVSSEPFKVAYKARMLPNGGTELAVIHLSFKDGSQISIVF